MAERGGVTHSNAHRWAAVGEVMVGAVVGVE
jgi:hypothetical protein